MRPEGESMSSTADVKLARTASFDEAYVHGFFVHSDTALVGQIIVRRGCV